MGEWNLQRTEVSQKNRHVSLIGLCRPTFIQQGKSFYVSSVVGCFDWVVANACLKPCMFKKKCVRFKG